MTHSTSGDRVSGETVVITLGGSLMVPDSVDPGFVQGFTELIGSFTKRGGRFFIITGGGRVCRRYQQGLREAIEAEDQELDWIGIFVTRLNAQFLRLAFRELAHPDIVLDPTEAVGAEKPVVVGAGWKPGWSTDYDAVAFAKQTGASKVLNLSNIDFVYTKDPKKFPDAEKITHTTWPEFRALLPEEWSPGLNAPFDPIAAREAEELGLEVAMLNGRLDNIRAYLTGEPFIGTTIAPA